MSQPIQLIRLPHSSRRARRLRRAALLSLVALAWLSALALCFAAPPFIAGLLLG